MVKQFCIFIFLLLLFPVASKFAVCPEKGRIFLPCQRDKELSARWGIDFTVIRPREFIALVRQKRIKGEDNSIAYMDNAKECWVTREDIDFLIPLLGSTETCKCLVSPLSSLRAPDAFSTLGGYAIDLINSYRFGSEYPSQFYNCPRTDDKKIKDIERWLKGVK